MRLRPERRGNRIAVVHLLGLLFFGCRYLTKVVFAQEPPRPTQTPIPELNQSPAVRVTTHLVQVNIIRPMRTRQSNSGLSSEEFQDSGGSL